MYSVAQLVLKKERKMYYKKIYRFKINWNGLRLLK